MVVAGLVSLLAMASVNSSFEMSSAFLLDISSLQSPVATSHIDWHCWDEHPAFMTRRFMSPLRFRNYESIGASDFKLSHSECSKFVQRYRILQAFGVNQVTHQSFKLQIPNVLIFFSASASYRDLVTTFSYWLPNWILQCLTTVATFTDLD